MPNTAEHKLYTVVELFCGCGGFSHGFLLSNRFKVVLGNDIKKPALRTFAYNNTIDENVPVTIEGDLRTIPADVILRFLSDAGIQEGELDCLIGGPPCQGFSQLRRSEERKGNEILSFGGYDRLNKDPRNDLVLRFLEVASRLRPKIILIENVPQMLRHGHNGRPGGLAADVINILNGMGYYVDSGVINAADFGIPQLRERVFFLASKFGPLRFPQPSHVDPSKAGIFVNKLPWVTVAEAIGDLPSPPLGPEDSLGGGPLALYKGNHSPYSMLMRSKHAFPFNHLTRTYRPQVLSIVREMRPGETWDSASARVQKRYETTIQSNARPGESRKAIIERLSRAGKINAAFFRTYYWSAYTRLAWEQPALTITANANFLGSGRFSHPEENRGITMREAARLQSFEDDFKFFTSTEGDDTSNMGVGLDMIGEAVPPLLAKSLASHIALFLDQHTEGTSTADSFETISTSAP